MKLICIPHAGGNATFYRKLIDLLPAKFCVTAVELSGHGKNAAKPLINNMEGVISFLIDSYEEELTGDFSLFGHSMGGLIAYELAVFLGKEKRNRPKHIFFSESFLPHQHCNMDAISDLPENEFLERIYRLGGVEAQLYKNPDFMKFFLPVIRADYRLVEKHFSPYIAHSLECSVTTLWGGSISKTVEKEWMQITVGRYNSFHFSGGHFYLNRYFEQVSKIIQAELSFMEVI